MQTRINIENVRIGQIEDKDALTGVTVILFDEGATVSLDVRGSAPGTRETDLLMPGKTVDKIHALVLSGGSAFGLDASCGVMKYLEENNIGVEVGPVRVPIVSQAIIFDLLIGNPKIRPDGEMGYRACIEASKELRQGNYGAGCGASVGKILGPASAMKSGIGYSEMRFENGLVIGALVCVNAIGDVFDDTGIIAGALLEDQSFGNSENIILNMANIKAEKHGNTTIGCILTNAKLNKLECQKISQVAHNGLAQSISPIHTSMDGDTLFTASCGNVEANIDLLCVASQKLVKEAVLNGVKNAEPAGGLISYKNKSRKKQANTL